jgi:hypothetical protein
VAWPSIASLLHLLQQDTELLLTLRFECLRWWEVDPAGLESHGPRAQNVLRQMRRAPRWSGARRQVDGKLVPGFLQVVAQLDDLNGPCRRCSQSCQEAVATGRDRAAAGPDVGQQDLVAPLGRAASSRPRRPASPAPHAGPPRAVRATVRNNGGGAPCPLADIEPIDLGYRPGP